MHDLLVLALALAFALALNLALVLALALTLLLLLFLLSLAWSSTLSSAASLRRRPLFRGDRSENLLVRREERVVNSSQ